MPKKFEMTLTNHKHSDILNIHYASIFEIELYPVYPVDTHVSYVKLPSESEHMLVNSNLPRSEWFMYNRK